MCRVPRWLSTITRPRKQTIWTLVSLVGGWWSFFTSPQHDLGLSHVTRFGCPFHPIIIMICFIPFFKSHLFYPIIIIPSHNIAMILWKVPGFSKAILGENSIWQKAYVWDLEDYHLFRAEQRWFRYCAGHLQYALVIRGNYHAGTLRHPERWYECVWK